MRLAILGATSQIAKDLVMSFAAHSNHELVLYARRPDAVTHWLASVGLTNRYLTADFSAFREEETFDAILNFVGVGDPAKAAAMGSAIFDVTLRYDELALKYVNLHPECKYIFLSSGAAYGSNFDAPVDKNTKSVIAINNMQAQDWYGVAKLHAECRHRSLAHLSIIDIRVFNYFSHTQDVEAGFLITDIVRAIQETELLRTSSDYIVRDFVNPSDFFQLVGVLLAAPVINTVVDCYSKAPVDKPTLLAYMKESFGLQFQMTDARIGVNATGSKPYYYSLNTLASEFGYHPVWTSLDGLVKEIELYKKTKKLYE